MMSTKEKQRIVSILNQRYGTTVPVAVVDMVVASGLTTWEQLASESVAMMRTTEGQFLNPPKCRKCGHTICPTVWACTNPRCPKNAPKPKRKDKSAR